jgi:hypothetical protein
MMSNDGKGYSGAVTDTLTAEAHRSILATFSPREQAQKHRPTAEKGMRPGDLFRSKLDSLKAWIESEQVEESKEEKPATFKNPLKGW